MTTAARSPCRSPVSRTVAWMQTIWSMTLRPHWMTAAVLPSTWKAVRMRQRATTTLRRLTVASRACTPTASVRRAQGRPMARASSWTTTATTTRCATTMRLRAVRMLLRATTTLLQPMVASRAFTPTTSARLAQARPTARAL